jgi:outer membrane protein OmpA-like peptidoglycan-associated protein
VVAAVLFIGGLIGGYWFYSQQTESRAEGTVTGNALPAKPVLVSVPAVSTPASAPALKSTDTMHADVYFDFDRSRLRADAVGILQEKAEILKKEGHWAVLIQGYADQHGPAEYNKTLALRRAGAVKEFLVELGVPETSIKVVTLGKDGSICDDQSNGCQRLNRRVHLEMMKLGPTAAAEQARPALVKQEPETGSDGSVNPETISSPGQ